MNFLSRLMVSILWVWEVPTCFPCWKPVFFLFGSVHQFLGSLGPETSYPLTLHTHALVVSWTLPLGLERWGLFVCFRLWGSLFFSWESGPRPWRPPPRPYISCSTLATSSSILGVTSSILGRPLRELESALLDLGSVVLLFLGLGGRDSLISNGLALKMVLTLRSPAWRRSVRA